MGWYKLNYDGAYIYGLGEAGCGGTIWNYNSKWSLYRNLANFKKTYAHSSLEAKLNGVYIGIWLALRQNISHL